MSMIRNLLLSYLETGALRYDEVVLRLARSCKLGFGVEPAYVISSAIMAGLVLTHDDGNKTWLRKAPAFVKLERGFDTDARCGYLSYPREPLSPQHAIVAIEGQNIEVQWADGTITPEPIHLQPDSPSVPGVFMRTRNVSVWIPLDHPGLKVREDAF